MAIILNRTAFLDTPITVEPTNGVVFSNENKGHQFVISCIRGGELQTLTGTVTARFMRANNTTILIAGNNYTGIVDGKAVVTLPQDCYNVPGRFQMTVFLTADGATSCIYACAGSVQRTQSGELIDSGEAVPTLTELLAQIDACEQATADATAAANAVPGLVAETFATNKAYTAGSYVYYNGRLYRFTADHAAGAWTGSDATAVKLADDVGELKSAVADINGLLSDGSTLLSDSLQDKTGASSGVTYTLVGNVVTAVGTAEGTSGFTMLGSTTSAPPEWMEGGKQYIFTLDNNTPAEVRLQAKTTTQTSIISFAVFEQSGNYIITIPENITVFRLLLVMTQGETANGTVTMEISNIATAKDLSDDIESIQGDIEGVQGDIDDIQEALGTIPGIEEDIDSIKSSYLELTTDYCTMIPDGTDFDTLTTPGTYKVTNNTHAGTMVNIPIKMSGKLIVMALSQTARVYQIYAATTSVASIYVRYFNGTSWVEWYGFAYKKVGRVKYSAGNYESGKATEMLEIYMPVTSGHLKYTLYHFVNTAVAENYNVWRIYGVSHVDDVFDSGLVSITEPGELECAVHLADRDDFSGGSTHGDEIMTGDVVVLCNGKPINMSALANMTTFTRLEIVRTSELYDPADHSTVVADHGVKYVFDPVDGLTIHQSLKWRVAETLTNCFMCMFLPSKTKIDRAAANSDFVTLTLPTDTTEGMDAIVKPKANAMTMWDTSSGFSANVSVPVYPTGLPGGDQASISNNKSSSKPIGYNYNKLYFKICGSGSSTIGELWKTTSVYQLDYA